MSQASSVDGDVGALLIEEIQPGALLEECRRDPSVPAVADLLGALHVRPTAEPGFAAVLDRVEYLFRSGTRNYDRRPDLATVIPRELYERGRRAAIRLATDTVDAVLLHGDLTPPNILDGGPGRGLVAIDPAPCLGDPAFDAVDLLLWQAEDATTFALRADRLARTIGVDADRLLRWSAAFAAMDALEIAEASPDRSDRGEVLTTFAARWT